MQLDRPHGQMSDSFLMSAFIILSGGLQDAYTYCCRDKVLSLIHISEPTRPY